MNQRDRMMQLLGQLHAISFPITPGETKDLMPYYDLIDSMIEQYIAILKMIYPDFSQD